MSQTAFGPYVITRELPPSSVGRRLLAVHEREHTSHVVHVIEIGASQSQQRRGVGRIEAWAAATKGISSTLGVECWSLWTPGKIGLVTPYTGASQGLVTLEMLLEGRGGRLALPEVLRAMTPLLATLRDARSREVVHGSIGMSEVLVDQHGKVLVEHFGLAAALAGKSAKSSGEAFRFAAQEVGSLATIAIELATGRSARKTWAGARANAKDVARAALEAWVLGFVDCGPVVATAAAASEALAALLRECKQEGSPDPVQGTPPDPSEFPDPPRPRSMLRSVVEGIIGVFRRSAQ